MNSSEAGRSADVSDSAALAASRARPRVAFNLDRRLGLSVGHLGAIARQATDLGYDSLWTTGGTYDPFQLCSSWGSSGPPTGGRQEVGISIVPLTAWPSPVTLATTAATTAELTGGRFILGIGAGHPTKPGGHTAPVDRPVAYVEDHLRVLRGLLAGDVVDHDGPYVRLQGASIGWRPPTVPLYVGALGPLMLRLAGAFADGVLLNWSDRDHVTWARARIEEGARTAGRRPSDIRIVTQVRVAIDEDVHRARRAIAQQFVSMTLRTPREDADRGYRAHAGRLGLAELITELARRQDAGETLEALAEEVPVEVIDRLAFAGPADGAATGIERLAGDADLVIIRCVTSDPSPETTALTLVACRPGSRE